MANSRVALLCCVALPAIGAATSARCDDATKWAEAGVKYSAAMITVIAQDAPASLIPSSQPPSAERDAIDRALKTYSLQKSQDEVAIGSAQATANLLIDGAAAVAVGGSGGTGTVAAVLLRGAAQASSDAYFSALRSDSERQIKIYLANQGKAILQSSGLEDMVGNQEPDVIRKRLGESSRLINDMTGRLPNDPNVKALATDLLIQTLQDTNVQELSQLQAQKVNFGKLKSNLASVNKGLERLAQDTDDRLVEQNDRISAIGTAVDSLTTTVTDLDARLAHNEQLTTFVADYVYNQLPADQKAAALRRGDFDDHFACTPDQPDCDSAKAKDDLISELETEAKVKQIHDDMVTVVGAAADVTKIATNLGVALPAEVGQGIEYSEVAVAAFTDVATGNYLGAAVAVTGLFAHKGPDPTMAFMSQHFAHIEAQLDSVLKNEAIIDHKIDLVSQSLDAHFSQLNGRLDKVDQSIEDVRKIVAAQNQEPWLTCNAIYLSASTAPQRYGFNRSTLEFTSVSGIGQMIQDMDQAIYSCKAATQLRVLGLFTPNWFGNFLDIDSVNIGVGAGERDYIKEIHGDIYDIVDYYLHEHRGSWSWALNSLTSPATTLAELDTKKLGLVGGAPACDTTDPIISGRLWPMVCNQPSPETISQKLLTATTEPAFAVDMARWSLVVSPIIDAYEAYDKARPFNAQLLIDHAQVQHGPGSGRLVISAAGVTLDYAIASAAMMEGDLATDAVYEALTAPPIAGDVSAESVRAQLYNKAARAVFADKHLAANVAMRYLRARFGIWDYTTHVRSDPPLNPIIYRTSLERAQFDNGGDVFSSLRMLFGYDVPFSREPDGTVELQLVAKQSGLDEVKVPLPESASFDDGRLTYNHDIAAMAAGRAALHERLRSYDVLVRLAPADQQLVAGVISRASVNPAGMVAGSPP